MISGPQLISLVHHGQSRGSSSGKKAGGGGIRHPAPALGTDSDSRRFATSLVFLLLCVLCVLSRQNASAAEYGPAGQLWRATSITNATGTATNVNVAIDVTKVSEFTLQVVLGFTNACAGTYDVAWTSSGDNVTYASGPAMPGASGWFSIPLTNGGTTVTWITNIPMSSRGWWKLNYGTNQAGQSLTNANIAGWVKPKKTAQDY